MRVLDGSTSDLVIGWNPSVDDGTVTEYRVYADGTLLGTTAGLSLRHSGLAAGSTHAYEVVARDAEGTCRRRRPPSTARAYRVVLPAARRGGIGTRARCPTSPGASGAMPTRAGRQARPLLGYGASGIATTIGWGPSSSNRHLTSYARTTFDLSDVSSATGLTLRIRGADGAAIFVNGQLAYNDNLPPRWSRTSARSPPATRRPRTSSVSSGYLSRQASW